MIQMELEMEKLDNEIKLVFDYLIRFMNLSISWRQNCLKLRIN